METTIYLTKEEVSDLIEDLKTLILFANINYVVSSSVKDSFMKSLKEIERSMENYYDEDVIYGDELIWVSSTVTSIISEITNHFTEYVDDAINPEEEDEYKKLKVVNKEAVWRVASQ